MLGRVVDTLLTLLATGRAARSPTTGADRPARSREFEFVYDELTHNLSQQSEVLESVRSRASLLIAAASVVTALLAGPTFDLRREPTLGSLLAIAVFLVSVTFALAIVWPRKGWNFRLGIKEVVDRIEQHPETNLAALHRRLAILNEQSYESNEKKIASLFRLFRWAAVALVVDVLLWLLALTSFSVCGVQF